MGKRKATLSAGVMLLAVVAGAQAGESLSCQVQNQQVRGVDGAPKVTEFIWSTAHNSSEPTGAIATSIGKIDQADALGAIALDGRPVQLPAEARGLIRFGKVYDFGNFVVLAYRAEREFDSTATPSEVVYRLDKARVVGQVDILPGDLMEAPDHCTLIP